VLQDIGSSVFLSGFCSIFAIAEIYEISGWVGREILTSNPCGVLPEKETVRDELYDVHHQL